jgi:hypothetical protein
MSNLPAEPKQRHGSDDKPLIKHLRSNFGAIVASLFYGGLAAIWVFMFCAHTFWYGEPIAIQCQTASPGQADCVLTYRALLRRSWNRSIEGVEAIQIDTRMYSSSEGGQPEPRYVVILLAEDEEYVVRQYARLDHPDLEKWRHRISQFSEFPEEGFAIAVDYNPWRPIINVFGFVALLGIAIFLFILGSSLILLGILVYPSVKDFCDRIRSLDCQSLASKIGRDALSLWRSAPSFQTIYSLSVGTTAMAISSRRYSRFSPTLVLLVGLALGSLGMVVWLGLRWVVVLGSLAVCMGAIAAWQRQLNRHNKQDSTTLNSANLLQKDTFAAHLNHLEAQFPGISQALWQSARQRAEAVQQLAEHIAQHETSLIPDLLEALHTVLDLVEQVAQALKAVQQVKTYRYQQLAQEKLYRSQKRLEHIHNQLQALRDQMILGTLQPPSSPRAPEVSSWLQTLITDNEQDL